MKVIRNILLLSASFLQLFSFTAFAQTIGTLSGGIMGGPQAQRGAPYSAVRETETIQTLSDGTHVTRKSHTNLYRDSQGRIRTEVFLPERPDVSADEPVQIMIIDPVEGVTYSLNPRSRTGTRNNSRTLIPPQPPPKPPATPPPPPPQPKQSMSPPTSEDLGMQMIEGVWARGRRITMTIPADTQGNDRPIVTVTEIWSSDELQTEVLNKRSDPRTGETTQRLTNIVRSEPDPALFRPPADYTITEPQR